MKNTILLSFLWLAACLQAGDFDHTPYDEILQKYVRDGRVNYQALKTDRGKLDIYLEAIAAVDPDDFARWSREEQMAFWINAYNAITIEGILRNYPIEWGGFLARRRFPKNSIRQIAGFWDTVFIKVMGRNLTLNDIEHKILRKQFRDPRVHFVLVCASLGCPKLEGKAFYAQDLEQRLDEASRNFIIDPNKTRLERAENVLYLSSIFKWYSEDFKASRAGQVIFHKFKEKEQGVLEFLFHYLSESDKNFILQSRSKIKYLDYDWTLNDKI